MADQSLSLAVNTIIHYPREAQVGRTYLMTIDLHPQEGFEWQHAEEEYPIYFKAGSDLFHSKPVSEPVVVLHRFGGSYGEAKFLLAARGEEMEGKIWITLVNQWGVHIRTIQLSPINIKRESISDSNISELSFNSELISEVSQVFISKESYAKTLLIGGSEDKIHGREILYSFFQQAGGTNARIAVISFLSQEAERIGRIYKMIFEEMGAGEVQVIEIPMQEYPENFYPDPYFEVCSGIFISGIENEISDSDRRYFSRNSQPLEYGKFANTPIFIQIQQLLARRNVVLAATGTAMDAVGDFMLVNHSSGTFPSLSLAELGRGLGFIPGVIYCSHFYNHNRMAQLLSILSRTKVVVSFGVDEDTCTFLEDDGETFQVLGKGTVTVIDQSSLTYSNFENVNPSDPLSLHNLRIHVLSEGDRFNSREKIAISPQGQQSSNNAFTTLKRHNVFPDTNTAIILIGGEEENLHKREILNVFFNRSGGTQSHIGIIPCASRNPVSVAARYHNIFVEMGAKNVEVFDIRDRSQGEDPSWRNRVEICSGIFMTGGDQVRLCGLLADTPLIDAIRQRAQLGEVTLGGTGAGAAVMGHIMVAGGGSGESPNRSLVDMAIGLGFIPDLIVDTHFHDRNRINRLLSAVAMQPDRLGIGIDQNTCLILEKDMSFHVFGSGTVTVMDVNDLSYTNEPEIMASDPISIHNIRFHLLSHGSGFDLRTRSPIQFGSEPIIYPAKAE